MVDILPAQWLLRAVILDRNPRGYIFYRGSLNYDLRDLHYTFAQHLIVRAYDECLKKNISLKLIKYLKKYINSVNRTAQTIIELINLLTVNTLFCHVGGDSTA